MAYSFDQLRQLAVNAGFQGNNADTAAAIALAESGGNPNSIAFNDGGKGYNSYGLMQINGVNDSTVGGAINALDPQTSFNQAYTLSGGTNFSPWSTYNNGAYQQYLSAGGSSDNFRNFTPPTSAPGDFSVSDFPGSQSNHLITDGSGGVTNGNGDSFSFNDPNSVNPNITSAQNAANYADFGLQPLNNSDPLNNQTTGTDYNYFGLNPLGGTSLGDLSLNNSGGLGGIITGALTPSGSAITTPASGNNFYQGVLNNVKDFIVRFGLILLAIVLIGIAAWGLSSGELKRQYNKLAA